MSKTVRVDHITNINGIIIAVLLNSGNLSIKKFNLHKRSFVKKIFISGPVLWDTTVLSVLVARCSHVYRETKMSC